MEEKSLKLEDALKISKGDLVRVIDSWQTRNLSRVLSNSLKPNLEYEVKKTRKTYIDGKIVVLFYINKFNYSHYWFSRYRKRIS